MSPFSILWVASLKSSSASVKYFFAYFPASTVYAASRALIAPSKVTFAKPMPKEIILRQPIPTLKGIEYVETGAKGLEMAVPRTKFKSLDVLGKFPKMGVEKREIENLTKLPFPP